MRIGVTLIIVNNKDKKKIILLLSSILAIYLTRKLPLIY